jgi:DNA-directed RNA polymerase specialized sigma24 family protein
VERDEIEQFVTLRYAELLRTAYLLTGSTDRAEELVQTCLLKALPRWDRIADPLAYLRRAMANQRVSLWRRLRHELLSHPNRNRCRIRSPGRSLTARR